jgi:ubiquinone/menaquinone biosynthesis C-methylase UbiE
MNENPSRKEVRDYYDQVYHPRSASDRRPNRDYTSFLTSLRSFKKPGMLFLDVGCGAGQLLKEAQKEGFLSYGIDISYSALSQARSNASSAMLVMADGERLPFRSAAFHCVVCYGSLEHFENPDRGIEEVSRIMKDEGLLRVSVPNSRFWPETLGLYRGTGQILELSLSIEEWKRRMNDNGFRILSVKRDFGPPLFKNYKFSGIISRILLKIACLAPLRYNYQFIFLMRKEN